MKRMSSRLKNKYFPDIWKVELPYEARNLLGAVGSSPIFGEGGGARAKAEIDIRNSLSVVRATNALTFSTAGLVLATFILSIVATLK